jgi:hypothetical protein
MFPPPQNICLFFFPFFFHPCYQPFSAD